MSLRTTIKKLPLLPEICRSARQAARYLRRRWTHYRLKGQNPEAVFTGIYRRNGWRGDDSVSGTGSDLLQTRTVSAELPALFEEFGVHSMLDIPCGDFHWMRLVDRRGVDYIGADIVREIAERNNREFAGAHVRFQQLDLIRGPLPKADLLFCRDCLVHLSFTDIFSSLRSACASGAEYLLTTTFPGQTSNRDISTGEWRRINLQLAPFGFPQPLKTVNEHCTEGDGEYADKSLGLWRMNDIRILLARRPATRERLSLRTETCRTLPS